MKRLLGILLLAAATPAAGDDFVTHYEAWNYRQTPRYEETVAYCKKLAAASPWLSYSTFGESPQGRDLPLIIANKDEDFRPSEVDRTDKVVVMIQAGIHSGESDGKDAGLMLLRDIAVRRDLEGLLDHAIILFIPIFNVDGHEKFGPHSRINQNGPEEMGFRATAQRYNLNRDYLKADAPEMHAWLRLFRAWDPDFFVDCHVTDGADYQYVITYILDIFGNMVPSLTEWTRDVYLAGVEGRMNDAGYDIFPYVYLLEWPNPKGGMKSWVSTPRFSTGYTALRNRPGLLIETHMLKDYKTRVDGTYEMLKQTLVVLNEEREGLQEAIIAADAYTAGEAFRSRLFPLQFEPVEEGRTIDFKGVAFDARASELSGGMWYDFNGKPKTFPITYLNRQRPSVEADLPEAYIVPVEWTEVIERLELHGVELWRLPDDRRIDVGSYRFENMSWVAAPYEGRFPMTFDTVDIHGKRTFPAGSAVVDMNQPLAQVAAHILEPHGPDSYVYWGFFNTVFEQKEYSESYVMEKMARAMLADDPELRRAFEKEIESDEAFAADPQAILNWFYMHTPYWDEDKDLYPVGKIFDAGTLKSLKM